MRSSIRIASEESQILFLLERAGRLGGGTCVNHDGVRDGVRAVVARVLGACNRILVRGDALQSWRALCSLARSVFAVAVMAVADFTSDLQSSKRTR